MKIRVIDKDHQTESRWSGGSTWELAIFPEDARYLDRNFIWRLSTACSDREESSFTRLEEYDRILMVLEGDVVLSHGGERSVRLQSGEQDSFDGSIKTRCFGKLVRDYNLIMAKGCSGRLEAVDLKPDGEEMPFGDAGADSFRAAGLYCLEGYGILAFGEESVMIREGQQGVIDLLPGEEGEVRFMGEGRALLAGVSWELPEDPEGAKAEAAGGKSGRKSGASRESSGGEAGASDRASNGRKASGGRRDAEDGRESFAASYRSCLRLFARSNKWSKAFRRGGMDGIYYDRVLSGALQKLERRYVTTLVWAAGVIACFCLCGTGLHPGVCAGLAGVFTLLHLFLLAPLLYWLLLPNPLSRHMKSTEEMDAFERMYHQEEIADNPRLEKLMRKYRSDEDNYFADDSSPLRWLVRKK